MHGKLNAEEDPLFAATPQIESTVEIVLSPAEVDFLRSVTRGSVVFGDADVDTESLRSKLQFLPAEVGAGGKERIVVDLSGAELSWLQAVTRQIYSFITAEERRARLVLREKLLVAAQRLAEGGVRLRSILPV